MSSPLDIGDALAQVNNVRVAMGYTPLTELPNAHTGAPAACLFYRALSDCGVKNVYGDKIEFSSERQARLAADLWGVRNDGVRVHPPTQMRRTIGQFDGNNYPWYEETSE